VATGSRRAGRYATAQAAVNAGPRVVDPEAARTLASLIYSQRNRLGRAWRQWAENEIRKQCDPNTEVEARNELNRLMERARDNRVPGAGRAQR